MDRPPFMMDRYSCREDLLSHSSAYYEAECNELLQVIREMYGQFWGTSESPGQDEANNLAKNTLDRYDLEKYS